MSDIGDILDNRNVDWAVFEQTGLHVVNAQDYDDELLTDISVATRIPMNSLHYGTFVVICPQADAQSADELMTSKGYKLQPGPVPTTIAGKPEPQKDLVTEVAEILNAEKLFKQFGKALAILGEQLGIGPIQDLLKKRGIKWRMSDDNDSLVFEIQNNVTGNMQPIARVSQESLNTQNDFQVQLTNMLDFAMGNSPGTIKQQQEKLNNQQQVIQDIARVVFPNDKSSQVASMMLS